MIRISPFSFDSSDLIEAGNSTGLVAVRPHIRRRRRWELHDHNLSLFQIGRHYRHSLQCSLASLMNISVKESSSRLLAARTDLDDVRPRQTQGIVQCMFSDLHEAVAFPILLRLPVCMEARLNVYAVHETGQRLCPAVSEKCARLVVGILEQMAGPQKTTSSRRRQRVIKAKRLPLKLYQTSFCFGFSIGQLDWMSME